MNPICTVIPESPFKMRHMTLIQMMVSTKILMRLQEIGK